MLELDKSQLGAWANDGMVIRGVSKSSLVTLCLDVGIRGAQVLNSFAHMIKKWKIDDSYLFGIFYI